MKSIKKELEKSKKEEKVKAEKPKKEFKIEIIKVGKLEDKTEGAVPVCKVQCYECDASG